MLYTVAMFIIIIMIAYIVGITIVSLVDKKLSNISINLPKQDIIVEMKNIVDKQIPQSSQQSDIQPNSDSSFGSNIETYTNYMPEPLENICYDTHPHNTCKYGKTNYPDPSSMTPIDKRYFKYNYPQNLTLQDYVNWLQMYITNPEDLPYNHLRNLKTILNGGTLTYQQGITPPPSYINLPLNTAQYFHKMYNEELDIARPLNTESAYVSGSNINQYPPADKRNKPEIYYPKYGQVV